MLRIGEFSKMSKTTIKTLRYYDKEGILKPEETDEYTGYRLYTTRQLFEIHRIQSFRQIGLSIDEIKNILSNKSHASEILENRKKEVLALLCAEQDQLSRIEFILSGQEEDLIMNYQATVKQLPECIVYSKETVIKDYGECFKLIPPLGEKVMKKYPDLKCTTPEYCFVKYLDGEYKEKDIHIEYCEAVDKKKDDFEDIRFKKIKSVASACVMHKGPYTTISNAYAFILKWVEENGYKMVDFPRESYIDGAWNKQSEDDWLTEVQIPVEKI